MSSGGEQKYHQNQNFTHQTSGNHLGPLLEYQEQQQNHNQIHQQNQWFSPFMGPCSSGSGALMGGGGSTASNYTESFTPILSPANTPQVSLHQLSLSTAAANNAYNNLSPLNSPALMPTLSYTDHQFQSIQQQQLHNQNLNQLYDFSLPASSSAFIQSSSTSQQKSQGNSIKHQKQPHPHPTPSSFQMSGHNNGDGSVTPLTLVPLTPSQLMQLSLNGMGVDSSSQVQQLFLINHFL